MRPLSFPELVICRAQGDFFAYSLEGFPGLSSVVFAKRFMHSKLAKRLDSAPELWADCNESWKNELLLEGPVPDVGGIELSKPVLYWLGYIYRYWSFATDTPSSVVISKFPAKWVAGLYEPYHTLDPEMAIKRMMESKGIELGVVKDEDTYRILKKLYSL